jgi:uncharacterized delta-60 repeat protein
MSFTVSNRTFLRTGKACLLYSLQVSILIATFGMPDIMAASVGAPDSTFGLGGKASTMFSHPLSRTMAIALQGDGKIVAAGMAAFDQFATDFAVARYNSDGSPDATFGTNGKVITDFFARTDRAWGVAVQPNGKIIVVGEANDADHNYFALVRYESNGNLDTSFGTNGKVTTTGSVARAVLLQPDAKIIIAGQANGQIALARYNENGTLDQNFGTGGIVITTTGPVGSVAVALVLQSDNKIVAGGTDFNPLHQFAVCRYDSSGVLDAGFGTGGIGRIDFPGSFGAEGRALAMQQDGKFVVAGYVNAGMFSSDFVLARFNANGSTDSNFGVDGRVTTRFDRFVIEEANGVVIQPDGKIIAAGFAQSSSIVGDFALARYNYDGNLDNTFGTGGRVTLDILGYTDFANAIALQPDGKVLVAGYSLSNIGGGQTVFSVARLNRTVTLSTPSDFDRDGKTDISVVRASNNTWYILQSSNATFMAQSFGASGDRILSGDYDGDGRTDLGIYRQGVWYIQRSSNGALLGVQFGTSTDTPASADFDGDGKSDIAVFRPSTGVWYVVNSSDNAVQIMPFGQNGDLPLPGDFDGDGKADVAVFRPSIGTWFILQSSNGIVVAQPFGQNGDIPAPADLDGDGKADVTVFRPLNGVWYSLQSSDGGFRAVQFGQVGDRITPGDYDADGKTDVAVFRPNNGFWYMIHSSNQAFTFQQFGLSTDIPVPSAFLQ